MYGEKGGGEISNVADRGRSKCGSKTGVTTLHPQEKF